jgi:HAMP domain-containing protein
MDVSALLLLLFLVFLAWCVWAVMFLSNDPGDEIRQVKRHQFLGPGGPDDPFANDPYDD